MESNFKLLIFLKFFYVFFLDIFVYLFKNKRKLLFLGFYSGYALLIWMIYMCKCVWTTSKIELKGRIWRGCNV